MQARQNFFRRVNYAGIVPVLEYGESSFAGTTYDQVLLRPELMYSLRDLRILNSDGEKSLLTLSGLPDKNAGSDHLPIYFQLEL